VGDLSIDTELIDLGGGNYRATLSPDWEIWGPMGGYVASVALRAVGRASRFHRPASFFCHYLAVATFDDVDVSVTKLKGARRAESHWVEVTQGGTPILEATVWSIGDVDGLVHNDCKPPLVPRPELLRALHEVPRPLPDDRPRYPFWDNVDVRLLSFEEVWPPRMPNPSIWRQWCRLVPTSRFEDPWLDACRSLIFIDIQSWPSASGPHVADPAKFTAPMLDLYVAFHDPNNSSEWLLADGSGPVAKDGLMGWNGRLWSLTGDLVASGMGQMLCRHLPSRAKRVDK